MLCNKCITVDVLRKGDVCKLRQLWLKVDILLSLFTGGSKSTKGNGRSNGRKAKSPGPGLSGSERPSSVSSVHSDGDCNRRTPLTNRVWEDRPLSAGLDHVDRRSGPSQDSDLKPFISSVCRFNANSLPM